MTKRRSARRRSGCGSLFAAAGTLLTASVALIGVILKAVVSILAWLDRQKFTVPIRGKSINMSLLGVLGLLVLLSSCCGITYRGMDSSWRQAGILPTHTLVPTNAPTRTSTPRPAPTSTRVPTRTPTPTSRPSPSPTPTPVDCTWSAAYVADVTIPDGTRLDPGAPFVKTWRVHNDGTCDWENVQLAFTSGEQMQAPSFIPIPPTSAGAEVDISVEMVAPTAVGDYSAGWSICQGDNCFYEVTVQIVSGDLPTPPPPQPTEAPQPTALPTEAPQPTAPPGPPAGDYLADGVWRCPGSTEGAAYVGSDKSDKFHYISCRHAKKIEPENRICFASRDAALNYDYVPCGVCSP